MAKIWQKTSEAPENKNLHELVEKFTVLNDYLLDQDLVPYDVQGSIAHAKGLQKIEVLTATEFEAIEKALTEIEQEWHDGKFIVKREHEDSHTAIEIRLVEKIGETGKKIHTGRSRNDQVLVTTRLFSKEKIAKIIAITKQTGFLFLDFAKRHEFVPMPGYTHTQRAMPTSLGMWAGSFVEMILMNIEMLNAVQINVDQCPLGSAAGFGVNFDLPREFVSQELGFATPVTISLTAQNMRGKLEADILSAMTSLASTLAHFATDIVLFCSQEFDYFQLPDALTTGSSIMPQKKNPDPAELLRARYSQLFGFECQLRDLTKNLISGYHRDLQLTKEPLMRGLTSIIEMLEMTNALIDNLEPKEENLKANFSPDIFAADYANELVKQGMTFRDAYREVGNNLDKLAAINIDENLRQKQHLGATGNLGLEVLEHRLQVI